MFYSQSEKGIVYICVTFSVITFGYSAKILGIFPVPSQSHRNLYIPLVEKLLEKGNHVTIISPYKEEFFSKNGSSVSVPVPGLEKWMQGKLSKTYGTTDSNAFQTFHLYTGITLYLTETILASKNVQELIQSGKKFDAVLVTESMNYAHKALATHFTAPLILFSSLGANVFFNEQVGNPAFPAYIPHIISGYNYQMSFFEKIQNFAISIYTKIYFQWYLFPKHDQFIKKYIPGGPNINQILFNVSLILLNSHPSINQPVPYVPNMVDIGGFHVKSPKKLPLDLQEYVDSAEDGFVYFSMGSNLRSTGMPSEKRDALLNTFSKLKQKVLWKWEDAAMSEQPPNIKLAKWLPQQNILAHPNIKLFVTHGGLLSTTETVFYGVPVLVIPIFGDQILNAKVAVSLGFGLSIRFNDVTEERLTHAIDQLLNSPKYTANARLRSQMFRSRKHSPLETAVDQIEYIIRRKGAPHLQVAGLSWSIHEYLLLDMVILFATAFSVMLLAFYMLCRMTQTILRSIIIVT